MTPNWPFLTLLPRGHVDGGRSQAIAVEIIWGGDGKRIKNIYYFLFLGFKRPEQKTVGERGRRDYSKELGKRESRKTMKPASTREMNE